MTDLAQTASLIGDPARANMLVALMDGRALVAGELARVAGIGAPAASAHLARLLEGGLVAVARQGRHRYYRLASPAAAATIEALMVMAGEDRGGARPPVTGPRDKALRHARSCYDHLAGEVAVAIVDSLVRQGHLQLDADGAAITEAGQRFLAALGLALPGEPSAGRAARRFCRPCLDWSERRHHLAGQAGVALLELLLARHLMRRRAGTRALEVTPAGALWLERHFGIAPR